MIRWLYMFNKNNLKYILIEKCFFFFSSIYLTKEQLLSNHTSFEFVNITELLFGSQSMVLRIFNFELLYYKNKILKKFISYLSC